MTASKTTSMTLEQMRAARRIGVLHDPSVPESISNVKAAGRALNIELVFAPAQTKATIAAAIRTLIEARVAAVNVLASANLNTFRTEQIAAFAQARLPAIYQWPETAEQGGLIGYGPRNTTVYGQVAALVNKVLRGAKPADLPVEQPTKFELIINGKTAKALGLTIPQSLLLRADEVIH